MHYALLTLSTATMFESHIAESRDVTGSMHMPVEVRQLVITIVLLASSVSKQS